MGIIPASVAKVVNTSRVQNNLPDFLTFRTPKLKLEIRQLTSTGARAEGSVVPKALANGLGFADEFLFLPYHFASLSFCFLITLPPYYFAKEMGIRFLAK